MTVGLLLCALGGALFAAPPAIEGPLRSVLIDAIVCSQGFARQRIERWMSGAKPAFLAQEQPATSSVPAHTAAEWNEIEARCRRLTLRNAQLREELQLAETYGVSPFSMRRSSAAGTTVLRASLINRTRLMRWQTVRQLERGASDGVAGSALVLDDKNLHIDQGSEAGLAPELDVLVGRCVVGRIASVGRWTSTVELITDSRYRGLAQLVRPSQQGGTFGTEGILAGTGTSQCRLTDVPTTQSVRPGDEVYTSNRDGRTPVPLYYGRVVGVQEAGRNWDIVVEPAVKPEQLQAVDVLQSSAAPLRPLAE